MGRKGNRKVGGIKRGKKFAGGGRGRKRGGCAGKGGKAAGSNEMLKSELFKDLEKREKKLFGASIKDSHESKGAKDAEQPAEDDAEDGAEDEENAECER